MYLFLRRKNIPLIVLPVILVIGILIGYVTHDHSHEEYFDSIRTIRTSSASFPLVFPILGTESLRATTVGEYEELEETLKEVLEKYKKDGSLLEGSIYVRDLNRNLWVGVGEDVQYAPASLFKLPIALAVYKTLEIKPSLASEYFIYTEELARESSAMPYGEKSSLVVGKAYTLDELLTLMLANSDNGAKDLLASRVDEGVITQLFKDAGVEAPKLGEPYVISPKTYAFFFRMLYNGSYLGRANSQKLLETFTKTAFKDGIVAGVKSDVPIAHKFGLFETVDPSTGKELFGLHDCGIVYDSNIPYLICVMTKGGDVDVLEKIIAEISSVVYKEIIKEK